MKLAESVRLRNSYFGSIPFIGRFSQKPGILPVCDIRNKIAFASIDEANPEIVHAPAIVDSVHLGQNPTSILFLITNYDSNYTLDNPVNPAAVSSLQNQKPVPKRALFHYLFFADMYDGEPRMTVSRSKETGYKKKKVVLFEGATEQMYPAASEWILALLILSYYFFYSRSLPICLGVIEAPTAN